MWESRCNQLLLSLRPVRLHCTWGKVEQGKFKLVRMGGLRRAGHLVWEEEGVLLCWGGVQEHRYKKPKGPNRTPSCGNSFHDPAEVIAYSPVLQSWEVIRVGGDLPRPSVGAVGVPLGGGLLVWGGLALWEEFGFYRHSSSNHLHFLSTVERSWEKLKPEGQIPPASEKAVGWCWSNKAFFFSGWSDQDEEEVARVQDFQWEEENVRSSGGGWHNALTCYQPRENSWQWPRTRGRPPPPRAGAAAAVVGDTAFVFGGRSRRGRMDDLHCLHLPSLTWTEVAGCSWPDPWTATSSLRPLPRSLHTLTAQPGTSSLALYGGLGQLHAPLQDLWLLHTDTLDWEEVELAYDHGEVRCWHGAAVLDGELLVHSGLTQEYYLTRQVSQKLSF